MMRFIPVGVSNDFHKQLSRKQRPNFVNTLPAAYDFDRSKKPIVPCLRVTQHPPPGMAGFSLLVNRFLRGGRPTDSRSNSGSGFFVGNGNVLTF
jgi:hypothetical protein